MVSRNAGVERLAAVPMFASLSKRDLARLWDRMKVAEHAPGHRIVVAGRTGHGFHLLLDGSVSVERGGATVSLGPGDFFGEMSLIDEGPRTATVTATTAVTAASLSSGEFRVFAKQHPDLLWKLLVSLTARLREEQQRTARLSAMDS